MKNIIILTIIILLGTTAEATCRTYWDYCIQIELPQNTTNSYIVDFDNIIDEVNLEGIRYVNDTLDNIVANITNTTDADTGTLYIGPEIVFGIGANPDSLIMRGNNTCGTCNITTFLEICLNGTYIGNLVAGTITSVSSQTNIPTLTDFDAYYRRKWTYKDEISDQNFNFTINPANMDIYCDNYATFQINLTDEEPDGGPATYQTLERGRYEVNVGSFPARIREDTTNQLEDDYYLTNTTAANPGNIYTFTLQDYTGGDCYRGTLSITSNVNETLHLIDVQRFSQDSIINSFLTNNTNYFFTVECADLNRNIGSMIMLDSDPNRNIITSTPELTGYNQRWDNLSITISQDFDTSTINCVIEYPTSVQGFFRVYNYSDNTGTLDYTAILQGTDLSFSYTSQNTNVTYLVECEASNTEFNSQITQIINIRNSTAYLYGFDVDMPATLLGLQREFILAASAGILAVIIISLGSGITYTLYTIVAMIFAIFMWYVNWLPEPYGLYSLLLFFAVALHLVRRRKGVEA
jgi:hypothetical protein